LVRVGLGECGEADELERVVDAAALPAKTPRAARPVAAFRQTVVQGNSVGS